MKVWRCASCGHETLALTAKVGLDPSYAIGPCNKHAGGCGRKDATHRLVGTIEQLEGEQLKQTGMQRATRASTPSGWVQRFDAELVRRAESGATFTSEDVTAVVGQPPSSGAVGARMNAAARRGLIEHVGYTKAQRKNQHAAELRTWKGVNR